MPPTCTPHHAPINSGASTLSATLLRIDAVSFLSHLSLFSAVSLIVRGEGVSLFRRTQFGDFHPLGFLGESSRHDLMSGLTLDASLVRRICYLSGGVSPGAFELEFEGIGFSLALLPKISPGNHDIIASLLVSFGTDQVTPESIRRRGASDWLDEGFTSHGKQWRNRIGFDRERRMVDVLIQSGPLAIGCRMSPVVADRDRNIIRLSDTAGNTVLHFDSRTTAFSTPDLPFWHR